MCDSYIPIVDFESCRLEKEKCSQEDLAKVGKLLVEAFSDVGFVYLKNYGITDSYVEDLQGVTGKYFTSPLQDKLRYKRKGTANFGWVATGEENPRFFNVTEGQARKAHYICEKMDPNVPCDYKEFFNVNGGSFDRDKSEWPDDIAPGFSHGILDFMERAQKLSHRILHALAIGLGLKDEFFFHKCHSKMHSADSFTTARTLYYPPVTADDLLPGQLRLGEHSDLTTISLVFQDSIGGLQVKKVDGAYIDAQPYEDTVLINVGDTLELWTDHKLKSTKHRVVFKEGELRNKAVRRSLVYFVHPNNDAYINKPFVYKDESLNVADDEPIKLLTSLEWIMEKMKLLWDTEEK